MIGRWLAGLLIFSLLTACQPSEPATSIRATIWGDAQDIAQTQAVGAPTLVSTSEQVYAFWIASDNAGVHMDASTIRLNPRSSFAETTVLPLPVQNPSHLTAYLGQSSFIHLLWLNMCPITETTSNDIRCLFHALITHDLQVERGPTQITTVNTRNFSAIALPNGTLQIAWTGGASPEPNLYKQMIDSFGRPLEAQYIMSQITETAILSSLNTPEIKIYAVSQQGQLIRFTFRDGFRPDTLFLGAVPYQAPTDILESFQVGSDGNHDYAMWNIHRAGVSPEVWMSAGALQNSWSPPARLQLTLQDHPVTTGFNGGDAQSATLSTNENTIHVYAGNFIGSVTDSVPFAALTSEGIQLIYFSGGEVSAIQAVVDLEYGLFTPHIQTDRTRNLYLAWVESEVNVQDRLYFATTAISGS